MNVEFNKINQNLDGITFSNTNIACEKVNDENETVDNDLNFVNLLKCSNQEILNSTDISDAPVDNENIPENLLKELKSTKIKRKKKHFKIKISASKRRLLLPRKAKDKVNLLR